MNPTTHSPLHKAAAWSVHLFTASGMVAGFLAIVAVSEGRFFHAFAWLFAAFVIDGVDGSFARLFRVNQVLPGMSGKTIDYVVDFANYALIPAYIMYAAPQYGGSGYLLPEGWRTAAAATVLLVSAIYYGKEGMVSSDYYFIGFPVMWNFVAFYLYYVFALPDWGNLAVVLVCAILHFVPLKYVYPSRTQKFMLPTITAFVSGGLGAIALVVLLEWQVQAPLLLFCLRALTTFTVFYVFVLCIYHTYIDKETRNV